MFCFERLKLDSVTKFWCVKWDGSQAVQQGSRFIFLSYFSSIFERLLLFRWKVAPCSASGHYYFENRLLSYWTCQDVATQHCTKIIIFNQVQWRQATALHAAQLVHRGSTLWMGALPPPCSWCIHSHSIQLYTWSLWIDLIYAFRYFILIFTFNTHSAFQMLNNSHSYPTEQTVCSKHE